MPVWRTSGVLMQLKWSAYLLCFLCAPSNYRAFLLLNLRHITSSFRAGLELQKNRLQQSSTLCI